MKHLVFPWTSIVMALCFVASSCISAPTQALDSSIRSTDAANEPSNAQLHNVISLIGTPTAPDSMGISVMFDQGSWHGYGLGDSESVPFAGPFLLTRDNGFWLSKEAMHLNPSLSDEACDLKKKHSVPGRLLSHARCGTLEHKSELILATGRSSIQRVTLTNSGSDPVSLRPYWQTKSLLTDIRATQSREGAPVHILFNDSAAIIVTEASESTGFHQSGTQLKMNLKPRIIQPSEHVVFDLIQSAYFDNSDLESWSAATSELRKSIDAAYLGNARRWSHYTSAIESMLSHSPEDVAARRLAMKAVQTLIGNWRSPAGDLKHDGLIPSYAVRYFHGYWAWDSWKHAAALSRFAPELAKSQIRAMFAFQNERGMVADVVYPDGSENNWRDTKPPLSTWAVSEVYNNDGDLAFVEEMMPHLISYHQWWYLDRDHDGDGVAEYGSTDGPRIAAAWESGMDNAVRFDRTAMLKNNPFAWSFNQESIDLNAFLAMEKRLLAELLQEMGENEAASAFRAEADDLENLLRNVHFDEVSGYFYDADISSGEHIKVQGPEGWIPLWTGIATNDQAALVRNTIADSGTFDTFVPFPTLSADHPEFDPHNGYWPGPVWLDQAYFAIIGLRDYGFVDEADRMTAKLFQNAEGFLENDPFYENYHPLSGKALNAPHFSWSAAHTLLLIDELGRLPVNE